jgi:hypothetical protein
MCITVYVVTVLVRSGRGLERYGLIAEITGQHFRRDAKKSISDGRGVSVASGADSRELENLSRSRYKLYFRFSTP